ncbi:hypothetical protein Aspvir_009573 [Aspergillus viridinutans]|uniref:G-protein coupled receptors family 2 profile 2 domain-containing protein n=1 Tax=Aspergillus viridinutans TaxID=75553 RepID=A0A9P3C440_ASPVI|nr:uncharacterized protein Aspvir_009573 [Aspergillus viridinutans]GIK05462.1 hypothetical protein Aspvir_009573 [Aspergillus viridinutans]
MALTEAQIRTLTTVERVASILSILGVITIIGTFAFSRHFRNPMHRLIFINAFYNLFDFIATMIATSGPAAGNSSPLCQFQGFCLQMFPMADVLWTLAMACDVFLVVYYQFNVQALRKLEIWYIAIITSIVSIPAIIFLFIHSPDKGPMYGGVTLWCSISPNWVVFRIVFYYGPIWFLILSVLLFYILVGIKVIKLRHQFNLSRTDHIALSSNISTSNHALDQHKNTVAVTVQIDIQSHPASHVYPSSTEQNPHSSRGDSSSHNAPLDHKRSKHSNVSFRQYILMPMVFFLVLLATWVAPTINRLSALVNPNHVSYPLLLAVGAMGSLRGFWNGVVFITLGMKGWKREMKLREDQPKQPRLHSAVRYGLTQALIAATALAQRRTIAEVICREWSLGSTADHPIDILASCHRNDTLQLDRMIMKKASMLPHASFVHVSDMGPQGTLLMDYVNTVTRRIQERAPPGYHPRLHFATVLGDISGDTRLADFLGQVSAHDPTSSSDCVLQLRRHWALSFWNEFSSSLTRLNNPSCTNIVQVDMKQDSNFHSNI